MPVDGAVRLSLAAALALGAGLVPARAMAKGPTRDECIDANEEAQDLRREGSLIASRERLGVCVASECPGPVRDDCAGRLREVESAIPSLLLAPDDSGAGMHVTLDGRPIEVSARSRSLPVDPGAHRLVFERDGEPARTVTVVLREGERDLRVDPVWIAPSSGGKDWHRPLGLVMGGVGAAGLAVGGVLAVLAKSTDANALSSECSGDPNACSAAGAADGRSAHAQARASTFALLGGGALLAAGAVVYFTAPGERRMSLGTAVDTGGAGLRLNGEF